MADKSPLSPAQLAQVLREWADIANRVSDCSTKETQFHWDQARYFANQRAAELDRLSASAEPVAEIIQGVVGKEADGWGVEQDRGPIPLSAIDKVGLCSCAMTAGHEPTCRYYQPPSSPPAVRGPFIALAFCPRPFQCEAEGNCRGYCGSTIGRHAQPVAPGAFQSRVDPWMQACLGPEISKNRMERNHRFIEEALELVQANGCTREEAYQLVDYVFARPIGAPHQEVGGVMVTLAALCLASGLDMDKAAEDELARIWTKVDVIRAKQAAKPKHSPLPQHVAPPADTDGLVAEWAKSTEDFTRSSIDMFDHIRAGDKMAARISQLEAGKWELKAALCQAELDNTRKVLGAVDGDTITAAQEALKRAETAEAALSTARAELEEQRLSFTRLIAEADQRAKTARATLPMARYWINQPSTHQAAHPYHGCNVLAPYNLDDLPDTFVDAYFTRGDIGSIRLLKSALSKGWKAAIDDDTLITRGVRAALDRVIMLKSYEAPMGVQVIRLMDVNALDHKAIAAGVKKEA